MPTPRSAKRAKWRPKKTPGQMNATERRFEENVLLARKWVGEIERYLYEPIKFRFGKDFKATYTPDFFVFRTDGLIEVIDVKGSGGWEDATRNKIKACARLYPEFIWLGETEIKGHRGKFKQEEF